MQLMDRVDGTSFFLPSGLVVSGQVLTNAGGGNPLLWQHLFWFLAHPDVYVLILPGMEIVAEIIANNTRKPLWGYRTMVYLLIFIGFMSFMFWGHLIFMTGMGTTMAAFFQTTTMIISIPSVVILTALIMSLWGGSIRYNTPMLFAVAFLPMFGIGGLTALPLGLNIAHIPLHDTYYVIAHFTYVVAPGTIFAIMAGICYWYPKATGRKMNETLGKIHFAGSLVCMNVVFMPMFIIGLAGVSRRLFDAGTAYNFAQPTMHWNAVSSWGAWTLALFQLPFIFNFFWSIWTGAPSWPRGDTMLNVPLATVNTIVLISSSVTMVMAWASLMRGRFETFRLYMGGTILFGLAFLVIKYFEYSAHFHEGAFPSTNNFLAIYYTLTGLHGLHVLGGMVVNAYFWGPGAKLWKTNPVWFTNRVEHSALFWHFVA